MKGEIYNFVLFSEIGSGTVADKSFFVNWSILPESQYKLTFSFASSNLANSTTYEAMLFINEMGCCNNIEGMGPYGSTANNAGFIGIIRDNINMGFLSTNLTDNPPSYLRGRPTANQITVKIHRNNAFVETDYTPLPDKYTLILSLEQLD
jgi:hypothetical protein